MDQSNSQNRSNHIRNSILESIQLKTAILNDEKIIERVSTAVELLVTGFSAGQRVFFAGNGGSAADAQHLAAEFVGRFYYDRPPLPAEALSTNSSDLTCIGNDYGFEHVFSRALEAKGREHDIFFAISTSGNSPNIVNAAQIAKKKNIKLIGLTGKTGGRLNEYADVGIQVPSTDTARIQECHILIGHMICERVEAEMFPKHRSKP